MCNINVINNDIASHITTEFIRLFVIGRLKSIAFDRDYLIDSITLNILGNLIKQIKTR